MSEWKKPGKCESAHCVEIKKSDAFIDMMFMRSSLRPEDTILVTSDEFAAFVQAVKDGEYDDYAL